MSILEITCLCCLYAIGAAVTSVGWFKRRRSLTHVPWDNLDYFMMYFFIPLMWPIGLIVRPRPKVKRNRP